MNILLVVRWPVGGIRTYFRYIYSQPIFAEAKLTIIGPDLSFSEFVSNYFDKSSVTYLPCSDKDEAFKAAVRREVKRGDYDLVHSHGYSAGALTALALTFFRTTHVMTAHDVYRPEQFRGLKKKIRLFGLNLIYSRLNGVLTVGQDCKTNFQSYIPLVGQHKILNIDHGIDTARFANAAPRDIRNELGLPRQRKIVGFFGRFMAQKGFVDLVKAIRILSREIPAEKMPVVVTFGWGGFIREDYKVVQDLGVSEFFIQLPFTDDVPSAIQGVDMVAMPSRWEACGLLAMEVLAAGKPLIGTQCIGLRCVLEGTPAPAVPPSDPEALASAIKQQLQSDGNEFKDYQEIALDRFCMERPAKALYDYYQHLLGS